MPVSLDADIRLTLQRQSGTSAAEALTSLLVGRLWRGSGKRRPSEAYRKAIAALTGDLLASAHPDRSCYSWTIRSAAAFAGQPIGYRPFKRGFDALLDEGYIELGAESIRPTRAAEIGLSGSFFVARAAGRAGRFRATDRLFALCQEHGITPANATTHFLKTLTVAVHDPLIVRSACRYDQWWKVRGKRMPIDYGNPKACALRDEIHELNAFLGDQRIEPDCHQGFSRIFNEGDHDGFDFNRGGRLTSNGAGSYQQMPKQDRSRIRINGQPVVEIDIRASHLTLLHGLMNVPFDPSADDPYQIDGIPRDIIKQWVTMTLGNGQFHKRWPSTACQKYHASTGKRLGKDHPIAQVKDKVLNHIPILKSWDSSPIRWADLHFIESQIIIQTMLSLKRDHGIPSLPVHDSLIVPKQDQATAIQNIREKFFELSGIPPFLSVK